MNHSFIALKIWMQCVHYSQKGSKRIKAEEKQRVKPFNLLSRSILATSIQLPKLVYCHITYTNGLSSTFPTHHIN